MTSDIKNDQLLRLVAALPQAAGDGLRARDVRTRCRERLAANGRHQAARESRGPVMAAMVAILCATYLLELTRLALRLYRLV